MRTLTDAFKHNSRYARVDTDQNARTHTAQRHSGFDRLWQTVQNLLIDSFEPRVWQETDRRGQRFWRVYDPTTDRTGSFANENEVRIWIEQRYSA